MSRRILLVAPIPFDVEANPRAIRCRRLVEGLAVRGFAVEVVSFWDGEGEPPSPPAGAGLTALAAGSPFAPLDSRARRILRSARRRLGADPDGLGAWGRAATERVAGRAGSGPDLVLSVAYPIGALIAGDRIARRLDVPHVCDLGDPWRVRGIGERMARRRTLGSAAALITTNDALAAELEGDLRPGAPTLLAPAGGRLARRPPQRPGALPLFVHLGSITPARVDPRPAFTAIGGLERRGLLELRSHSSEWRPGAGGPLRRHLPPLSHDESLALIARADCVVLLGNRRRTQVPSKAFEIACTETWALCVSELADDPTVELLGAGGHAVATANDCRSIERGAIEILDRRARGRWPAPRPEHDWDRRLDAMAGLLERALASPSPRRGRRGGPPSG